MPSYQYKSSPQSSVAELDSPSTQTGLSNQSQLDLLHERNGSTAQAGLQSQQLSLFGDTENKALSSWINTPNQSAPSNSKAEDAIGGNHLFTRSSQPTPSITNTLQFKSSTSEKINPAGGEGQLELNLSQSNLETGVNRNVSAGSKLSVQGNPFQSQDPVSATGSVTLGANRARTIRQEDGSTLTNQMGGNVIGTTTNQGQMSGTASLQGSQTRSQTQTGPNGLQTTTSTLNGSGSVSANATSINPSLSAGYNRSHTNITPEQSRIEAYGINGSASTGNINLSLSRQQNTGTQIGGGKTSADIQNQNINLGTNGINIGFGQERHQRQRSINLDNGGTENHQFGNSKHNVSLGLNPSGLEGSYTGSGSLWSRDRKNATSQSTLSILESKASAALRRRAGLISGNASADLNVIHGSAQKDINSPRTNVMGETLGVDSSLSASGQVGAHAKAQGEINNGLSGGLEAFLGAKAGAKAEGSLVWERKESYSDVLRDHFNNFPGQWDDRLVERIPDAWLEKSSQLLFGSGNTRLATGSFGVDARVGLGGEFSGHAGIAEDGLIEFGGKTGGAFGVGGGVSTSGGLNPVAISRLGMLKGMEGVNTGYDQAGKVGEQLKERAANDAQLVGASLENTREEGGILGALAGGLINIDRWIRGLK